MAASVPSTHRCPGPKCQVQVSNVLFCCPDDWWRLPQRARNWISQTARMSLLSTERRAAIEFARRCWNIGLVREDMDSSPRS